MIELNCTYEESKKILDLGYDFSSVCTKFELYEADGLEAEKRYTKKIVYGEKVSEETVRSRYTLIGDEPWFQGKDWVGDFIPIIPKAALEACLPDINPSNDERLPDLDISRLRVSKYHIDMCDREHEEIIRQFKTVYEAFIWVHEHYPKELRKKFEEVMG